MKVFSTSLCFGFLALLSVMNLLKSAHGQLHLISGRELFLAKEHTTHEKLLQALLSRNPHFQRPSYAGVDLPSKPEDLRQLKKLKEGFLKAKKAELSHAGDAGDDNLSSFHTNKREISKDIWRNKRHYDDDFPKHAIKGRLD